MGLFSGLLGLFKKNPLAKEIELLQYAKYYVDSARSFVIQFGRIEEKNIPKFAVKIRNDIIKAEKCYLQANQKESGKQCKLLIELFSFLDKNPHFDSRTIARYNELCLPEQHKIRFINSKKRLKDPNTRHSRNAINTAIKFC